MATKMLFFKLFLQYLVKNHEKSSIFQYLKHILGEKHEQINSEVHDINYQDGL